MSGCCATAAQHAAPLVSPTGTGFQPAGLRAVTFPTLTGRYWAEGPGLSHPSPEKKQHSHSRLLPAHLILCHPDEGTRGVGGIERLLSLNISRTRPGSPNPTGFFFRGVGWWDLKLGPGCPCLL